MKKHATTSTSPPSTSNNESWKMRAMLNSSPPKGDSGSKKASTPSMVDSTQQQKRGRSVLPKAASPLKVPSPTKPSTSEVAKRERAPTHVYNAKDDSTAKKRSKATTVAKSSPTHKQTDASPPKATKVSTSPKADTSPLWSPPKIASPPKPGTPHVTSPPKSKQATPKTAFESSPPKGDTRISSSPRKPPVSKNTPLTPVVVDPHKDPPPPGRPAHLPQKAKAVDAGQALIHQITASTDMSNKTLSCRVNSVTPKVLTNKTTGAPINYMEMVLSQVNASIGCQIWLGDKAPHTVFKRMPQENHIVQISRVFVKKSSYDAARYHEVMLSGDHRINIHIVDDENTVANCPFVYDPVFLDMERSQSVSTTASLPIPELNLASFLSGFQ